jgi:hypothetical protein
MALTLLAIFAVFAVLTVATLFSAVALSVVLAITTAYFVVRDSLIALSTFMILNKERNINV